MLGPPSSTFKGTEFVFRLTFKYGFDYAYRYSRNNALADVGRIVIPFEKSRITFT
jgi:hypothetical protein